MLKGLKLKTKLPDKAAESSQQSLQISASEIGTEKKDNNKRWQKSSDDQTGQKREAPKPEKLMEGDLIKACEHVWNSFLEGSIDDTIKLLKELKRKERNFYEDQREENDVVSMNILEDPESDVFESIEKIALRNFDPKKSAYLISDIMAENVKSKGKSSDDAVYKMYKRKTPKQGVDIIYDEEYDTKETEEENKKKSKRDKKIEDKEKQREKIQNNRAQRLLANCRYCLGNNQIIEEQILSFSPNALLIIPDISKRASNKILIFKEKYEQGHLYLLPIEHCSSLTDLEDEQYDELKNFMKCLIAMYDKMDYGVVFIENYVNAEKSPHCILEMVATPRRVHEELPLYFKKALTELGSEWATHKKIIEIKKDKGGIRKQIPKGFPYFYIDFDTTFGYAQVIEKPKDYDRNFAHEIIGSLLNLDKSMTMFSKKIERNELAKMKEKYQRKWDEHDWTKLL